MGINWDLRCEKGNKEEEKESNLTQGMEEASRVANPTWHYQGEGRQVLNINKGWVAIGEGGELWIK